MILQLIIMTYTQITSCDFLFDIFRLFLFTNKRYQQQMLSIRNATEEKKCKNYHMTGNKEIFNVNKIIVSIREWKFMYK